MNRSKGARLYLKKRGDGRQATWIIRDGDKRIATGCLADDLAGAEAKLAAHIAGRPTAIETAGEKNPARIGCADVLAHYAREHAPKTAAPQLIGMHIDRLLPYWGSKKLDEIIGRNCREYIAKRKRAKFQGRQVSSTTASKELGTLQAAVNFWEREFGLTAIPRVTKENEPQRRERVLERDELARLLWQARKLKFPHLVRFLMIGRYTGTRQEAILKLRWLSSLKAGHIDLERGILYRRGGAEKETKKRRPPCALHPKLLWFCRKWQAKDSALGLTHVIHTGGLPIKELRASWRGTVARSPWSKVIEAAGMAIDVEGKRSSDITPHILRHTCVSWGLWEGNGVVEVAGIVGASPNVIFNVYGHHQLAASEYARRRAAK